MPLLMVCLEGLGKLAQKFPNIASTSIYYLRDFLVVPSPILLKLHRQQSERGSIQSYINITYEINEKVIPFKGKICKIRNKLLRQYKQPLKNYATQLLAIFALL